MAGIYVDGAVVIAVSGLLIKEFVRWRQGNGKEIKSLMTKVVGDLAVLNEQMKNFNKKCEESDKRVDKLEERFYECQQRHLGG